MTGTSAFLRGLAAAACLAAAAPVALLLLGPILGTGHALWVLLGAVSMATLARGVGTAREGRLRAVGRDLLWLLAALAFAHLLATPGLVGASLAAWGFGLILSVRAASRDTAAAEVPRDAFEAAYARAIAVLEEEP